mmetsp:Transcript_85014/g.147506  ORF Transcript_85014/g.147506 Transcript_85014/m.147506 type:complete len:157 (+) Transcript_85014:58-528(+)
MNHINYNKISDGTGRDTYIVNDDLTRHGAYVVQRQDGGHGKVNSHKHFRHWSLRTHVPKPHVPPSVSLRSTMSPDSTISSHRRGGPGWMPPIDIVEKRRKDETSQTGFWFASSPGSSTVSGGLSPRSPRTPRSSRGPSRSTRGSPRPLSAFEIRDW